jgi:pyruvate dehydrogenase E2 component (dihydrolipoamide acetyltransferase)
MRFEMKMPDLATTESDIRIVRWMLEPGQNVQRGQPLLEVETDKAAMEVESVASGALREVLCQPNDAVAVGQVIAVLEVEDAEPAAGIAAPSQAPQTQQPPEDATVAKPDAPRSPGGAGGMFARNRAAVAAGSPAAGAASRADIPLSVAQRVAAKRLQESKQTIPHFYVQTSVNAAAMIARRRAAEPAKLAWDAFFVSAAAKALAKFERLRCRFDGERLLPIETDAIGVAVDHENELYVIPIALPAQKTVEQISEEIRRSVERLRAGDPEMRQIRPALLTITNLGVCQVEGFVPIINPPEAAVLGIGRVMPTPVARDDGWLGVEQRCTITLSVDHRIASGKYAGDFLAEIARELETM